MTETARSGGRVESASNPPAPEERAAVPAAEARPAVPAVEKAQIRPEVDLKIFKAGDAVFYWQNGEWKTGNLENQPVRKRGVIIMTVDGEKVELEVAPYRVEHPRSTAVTVGGKEYTVIRVYPGENGAPLYDLVTANPADTKRGVDQETVKKWESGGKQEGGAEREGIVDLPQDIVKEMLLLNPDGIKAAMEEAYATLYTPERNQTRLEELLRHFFRNIDIDAGKEKALTLRQRLQQNGIKNWESFVNRFEGPLAEKFAGVLLQAAGSELRSFLAQKIGDIKKLAGDKRTWGEFLKDNVVDYSALSKMGGPVALRYLINTLVIGGTGVAAGIGANLLPFLPGGAKAAAVGGVVGFVKGLTQRWMGKDKGYFEEEAKRARAEAEADKKKLIADALVKRIFRTGADGRAELKDSVELSHFFAASLRRATEGDQGKLEIKDTSGAVAVMLTGDAVCMYHEALRRAAETEGLEVAEKTRLEFARALHALHNNKKEVVDTPPLLAKGLQWLTDSYAGRAQTKGGKEGDTTQIGGGHQLVFTTALGAGVAAAATMDGAAVRIGIGATYGVLRGQKAQSEADRRRADWESRDNLSTMVVNVSALLRKGSEATSDDLALARDYRDLLSALLGGKKFALPEKGATPSRLGKEDARLFGWFGAHSLDAAGFLQRDEKMRKVVESVQREISRSGFLERQATELKPSFTDALRSMKSASERLSEEAKNSLGVEAGRFFKRGIRSVVYGAIGAGISWGIGKGVLALKHHFAPPGEAVAAKPESAAAAAAPVAAEAPPAAPAPAVEFPPGSEVKIGDGITDPVSRQLLEKFKDDVAHGHKASVVLENGKEYIFRGDIHNEKTLHDFAVKVSAEMAELKGDIDLKAGTEHRLENVGGHVVLEEKNGRFGYTITGETQYTHPIDWKQAAPADGKSNSVTIIPEEKDWVSLKQSAPAGISSANLHPAGEPSLADQLRNTAADYAARGEIDLTPHSVSGGAVSSSAPDAAGADQVIREMQGQIVRQTAFHDWAMSNPSVRHYVTAGVIGEDRLEELAGEWGKTHPSTTLDSTHEEFLRAVRLEVSNRAMPAGGTEAEASVSGETSETELEPPAGGAPQAEADEGESAAEEPAHANAVPRAEAPASYVLNADHPVAVVRQGGDRIVNFLDQRTNDKHAVTLLEEYSSAPSGNRQNPLWIKLTPADRPVLARLEMHVVPGSLDPQPVVVFKTDVGGGATEDIFYRVVNKALQKMEEPPSTARLLT